MPKILGRGCMRPGGQRDQRFAGAARVGIVVRLMKKGGGGPNVFLEPEATCRTGYESGNDLSRESDDPRLFASTLSPSHRMGVSVGLTLRRGDRI